MSDFILAVSVILIFAFVLWFLKKINYFLGEDRKIIDREQRNISFWQVFK
ncbi:hypothetical protein [Anaerostipes sp.]